ncbi:MAG: oxidoreductase-like domain-containing protein [Xanthomonadales bacterium]|nr:oxidoreductase-like domain-containing protein [Xanthomonadales bacterium]
MDEEIKLADPRPLPPEEPDPEDCCGEGCVRCIYDTFDAKVERYKAALAAWLERHPEAS